MLRLIIALVSIAGFVACQQPKNDSTATAVTDSLATSNINDILLDGSYNPTQLQGIYTGPFDGSPISIAINYVSGKNVSGYNVHKGLKRNIRGTLEPMGRQFKLMLDEPGDNQYDGHFELFIDTASYTGQGTWTPKNDSSLKKKTFVLTRHKSEFDLTQSSWSDTAQDRSINLKEDGSATLSFYTEEKNNNQFEKIAGNWQQKGDSVLIFWQPNNNFPSRRSAFLMVKAYRTSDDTSTYIESLRGENTEWREGEF